VGHQCIHERLPEKALAGIAFAQITWEPYHHNFSLFFGHIMYCLLMIGSADAVPFLRIFDTLCIISDT
jgi:hypothetical protein